MVERSGRRLHGFGVRETLINYLVNTLRGLELETYFFIPKTLVIPDWAGWEEHAEAQTHAGGLRFHFLYQAVFQAACEGDWLSAQLTKVWESWGWTCRLSKLGDHYDFTGTSPDSFTMVAHGTSGRPGFTLMVTSPVFDKPPGGGVMTMPFAVTPDGPRSLREMQESHPQLFT